MNFVFHGLSPHQSESKLEAIIGQLEIQRDNWQKTADSQPCDRENTKQNIRSHPAASAGVMMPLAFP
jgi:hypothetical protein